MPNPPYKHVIWYLGDDNKAHKIGEGSDDLEEAKKMVLRLRSCFVGGKRRYKKIWIAGERPGPRGYFTADPEPDYGY